MSSSTRLSKISTGTRSRLLVLLCLVLLFAAVHLVLEAAARFAERNLDAYLWKDQDYLRLFSSANHLERGRGQLFIYGPSEAREGLLPDAFGPVASGLKPYQAAHGVATIEDGLVMLDYIERAYGPSAVPDAVLLGITTRFIANIRMQRSPLVRSINRYSPLFRVVEATHSSSLVPKSALESASARWALLSLQPDRYRRGLFAIASRLLTTAAPSLAANRWTWQPIVPSKSLTKPIRPPERSKEWLAAKGTFWELVHNWDPESDRDQVTDELRRMLDYIARHDIRLFVVNLPEVSWNRELYEPGRYESYLAIVQQALGETPFLDLRTFLNDDEYYDEAHPTLEGGVRLSKEVAAFINDHCCDAHWATGVP
jgi:hypothetical protein